jgi:hypothetical protein
VRPVPLSNSKDAAGGEELHVLTVMFVSPGQ